MVQENAVDAVAAQALDDALRQQIEALRARMSDLEAERRELWEKQCPWKVGMIVRDHWGEEFKLTKVRPWSLTSAMVYGAKRLKSGEWGRRGRYLSMRGAMMVEQS
jgi:hypothetical protein